MMSGAAIFISYAHKDEEWLKRLLVHLKPLEGQNQLAVWSDEKIAMGEKWHGEMQRDLKAAQATTYTRFSCFEIHYQ